MQEGAYTERNDSLFLMPSMAMEAESYKHYDYYKQYVYTNIVLNKIEKKKIGSSY